MPMPFEALMSLLLLLCALIGTASGLSPPLHSPSSTMPESPKAPATVEPASVDVEENWPQFVKIDEADSESAEISMKMFEDQVKGDELMSPREIQERMQREFDRQVELVKKLNLVNKVVETTTAAAEADEKKMQQQQVANASDVVGPSGAVEKQLEVNSGHGKDPAALSPANDSATAEEPGNGHSFQFRILFRFESLAQRRARLCSESLSPLAEHMLKQNPPFSTLDFSCLYQGKNNDDQNEEVPQPEVTAFWQQLWTFSAPCQSGLKDIIETRPNCLMVAGFVDHLFTSPDFSLIAELSGPKMDGHNAVVRLLCDEDSRQFQAAIKAKLNPYQLETDAEEMFLKTMFAMEFTWYPGCIVVFFDSRTMDPGRHLMGRLLLNGPGLKFGTEDGRNKWAASKFVCGQSAMNIFRTELKWMRYRTRKVPKELNKREDQIREVLTQKINEEMFPTYQVTAVPSESNFFERFLDGLGR